MSNCTRRYRISTPFNGENPFYPVAASLSNAHSWSDADAVFGRMAVEIRNDGSGLVEVGCHVGITKQPTKGCSCCRPLPDPTFPEGCGLESLGLANPSPFLSNTSQEDEEEPFGHTLLQLADFD